jgi:hypothetical protein
VVLERSSSKLSYADVVVPRLILLTVAALVLYPAGSALAAVSAPAAPDTKIISGTSGVDPVRSAIFAFKGSVGSARFQCSFDGKAWTPCASPKKYTGLALRSHTFRVRAGTRGSVDPTPALRSFTVETPQAAAKRYFPDSVEMDVPASCSSSGVAVDCPGGNPAPPAKQLQVASTRSLSAVTAGRTYDVTVSSNVQTLQQHFIVVSSGGQDCDMSMTSAQGSKPDWTITLSLNYVTSRSGTTRVTTSDPSVSDVEPEDIALSGGFVCSTQNASIFTGAAPGINASTLNAYFARVGDPMCAVKASPYVGPCPH